MKKESINTFLDQRNIPYEEDVSIMSKSWIKRGGIASFWVQPIEMSQMKEFVKWLQKESISFEVVGNTSNTYFLNSYNPLVVISTLKLKKFQIADGVIVCDCGCNMIRLSKYCIENRIAGYEGFIGLPGTVGGAAINNSGCYNSLTSDLIKEVSIIEQGEEKILTRDQLKYAHRTSVLKRKEIDAVLLTVSFDISKQEDSSILKNRATEFQQHRISYSEHKYPNLGTAFCQLDIKYSLMQQVLKKMHTLVLLLFIKKEKRMPFHTRFILQIFPETSEFRSYISDCGMQCFVWKDNGADNAFVKYMEFIRNRANSFVLEIDIKEK
jgi:UDP-N-acetylmuramate dehydrogenase